MHTLPQPDRDAVAASAGLVRRIQQEIDLNGGWLPFSRYMDLALYAPGTGYYTGGSRKFGADGDFVTAPEISPFFAAALAQQIADLLPLTGGDLYEFGAGSGRLAADLLLALEAGQALPQRYRIIEVSGELAARQRERIEQAAPHLLPRVEWLEALPARMDGVLIGNEVLDAMPCELIHWDAQGTPLQRGVIRAGDGFDWQDRPLTDGEALARAEALAPGAEYLSELPLAASAFVRTLGERLERGAVLLLDYGFPESEFYHPQRRAGTLMCHYRHHTHPDPFSWPGLTDITCHVDFTAIAQAGLDAGLDLAGYTSQAMFLMNCGIAQLLGRLDPEDIANYLPQSTAVQKLLSPAEMGELFKVIGFSRGLDAGWRGFAVGDRRRNL